MNKNIYLCGCVKNCGPYLEKNLNHMVEIGKLFNEYKIIISFDNSDDNSLNIINNFKKHNNKLILLHNNKKLSNNRVINICNARNSILNKIREINKNYEFFIMMDMDNRFHQKKLNIDLLKNVILNNNNWDSLSFHLHGYYDIWALSYEPFIYSCWHYFHNHGQNQEYVKHVKKNIINKLNNLKENELLDVHSAFCGIAIYKINKFINCNYNYKFEETLKLIPQNLIEKNIKNYFNKNIEKNKRIDDCEHRYFHLTAKKNNNAKIKICKHSLFI